MSTHLKNVLGLEKVLTDRFRRNDDFVISVKNTFDSELVLPYSYNYKIK